MIHTSLVAESWIFQFTHDLPYGKINCALEFAFYGKYPEFLGKYNKENYQFEWDLSREMWVAMGKQTSPKFFLLSH